MYIVLKGQPYSTHEVAPCYFEYRKYLVSRNKKMDVFIFQEILKRSREFVSRVDDIIKQKIFY